MVCVCMKAYTHAHARMILHACAICADAYSVCVGADSTRNVIEFIDLLEMFRVSSETSPLVSAHVSPHYD